MIRFMARFIISLHPSVCLLAVGFVINNVTFAHIFHTIFVLFLPLHESVQMGHFWLEIELKSRQLKTRMRLMKAVILLISSYLEQFLKLFY